jgi:RNA polymerase sigma-70 factor (ECF subfamily)
MAAPASDHTPSRGCMSELGPFRQLYEANIGFVWRALRRLGVPEADTADAAQEVFLVAHRKQSEFEGRSAASTWLFGIALRVASDRRKRADVRRQVLDEDAVAAAPDVAADGRRAEERAHATDLLQRALDALPLEQRAVFLLFELEGMTSAEIAEAVGCPIGTVYSRLRLAREAFQVAADRLQRPPPARALAARGRTSRGRR